MAVAAHETVRPRRAERPRLRSFGLATIALVASLLLMAGVFAALGANPVDAYHALLQGSLGSRFALGETLMVAVPLILCGLAAAIPFTAGLWNIGGEGQLYAGAFATTAVALTFPHVPGGLLTLLALLGGAAGGALWGLVAGGLKVRFGANEVIVTLMLNFVAIILVAYATDSLWSGGGLSGSTKPTPAGVDLPDIWPGTTLNLAIVITLAVAALAAVLLTWTRLGFALRVTGLNPDASRLAGFNIPLIVIVAFALGGACAGLAGACQVVGVDHTLASGFSPGYGYMGIAVALTARLNPFWIVPAALFFAVLVVGGNQLPIAVGISSAAASVVQATFVLLLLVLWVIKPRLGAEE
jgi:simple sugar transport system permease protein